MTVCIAAICTYSDGQYIVGCADRMVTAGDIEAHSAQPKVHRLSNLTAVLTAGAVDMHRLAIDRSVSNTPTGGAISVQDLANRYAKNLAAATREYAAGATFGQMGLTLDEFMDRHATGAIMPDLAMHLYRTYVQELPVAEAIVLGRDSKGAHLYLIDQKHRVLLRTHEGYAAIGSGSRHVDAHMMFNQHSPQQRLPHALFRIYQAKKIAEVAPGVGSATDLFFVGPASFSNFDKSSINLLDVWHKACEEATAKVDKEQTTSFSKVISILWNQQGQQTQAGS